MAKSSMDLLEILRKRGMEGDVDFLREALQILVEGIMDAEVSTQIGAQHGERNPDRITHPQRLSQPGTGTLGWGRWNCASPSSGRGAIFPACWNPDDAARRRCWR